MKLLSKINSQIYDLLSYTPLQYMLRSFENEPGYRTECRIFMDDETDIKSCAVHFEHKIFFRGNSTPEFLDFFENQILTPEVQKEYGTIYLFFPDDVWKNALVPLYPEISELRMRSLYCTESLPEQKPLPDIIVPITARFMESDVDNKQMIIDEVGETARFLINGFGYALVIDGQIQGFCTTEYHAEKELALGIEVLAAYQRKGYAKTMVSAALKTAISKR